VRLNAELAKYRSEHSAAISRWKKIQSVVGTQDSTVNVPKLTKILRKSIAENKALIEGEAHASDSGGN